jgi:cation:H+ antiporter
LSVLFILIGIVLLVAGGDLVVRGAGRLAISMGIRPLIVGLTVVAFSTSAPELAASATAALQGSPALAFGNVFGSNIANVGLILGLSGLWRDIPVQSSFLSREVPVLVGSGLVVLVLVNDGGLVRWEGALLLSLLVAYLAVTIRMELRAAPDAVDTETAEAYPEPSSRMAQLGLVALGVALLIAGANRLVAGAVDLAAAAGMSQEIIGLTVLAVGTSLPELASSLVAAKRGQGDLVLGNVVGSNIFNLLCILGVTALIQPMPTGAAAFEKDLWVMMGFAFALVPLLRRGRTLFRTEAAMLLAAYVVYVGLLAADV